MGNCSSEITKTVEPSKNNRPIKKGFDTNLNQSLCPFSFTYNEDASLAVLHGSVYGEPTINENDDLSVIKETDSRLKINDIVEAGSFILFPTSALIYQAYKSILSKMNLKEYVESLL
jgi:hypothetical protein